MYVVYCKNKYSNINKQTSMKTSYYSELNSTQQQFYDDNEAEITRVRESIVPFLLSNPAFVYMQTSNIINEAAVPKSVSYVTDMFVFADRIAYGYVYNDSTYNNNEQKQVLKPNILWS